MSRPPLRDAFAARFGRPCETITRAPGRVNLIGEHVDYNDGVVLPIAVGQSTHAACAARPDATVRVYSAELDDEQSWTLDRWGAARPPRWTSYVAGVATLLRRRGARLSGFDLYLTSEVPVGGGLSSSAALEVATALALSGIAGEALETRELLDLCRQAEHDFAGVSCGIMDQTASLLAKADSAMLLDCRERTIEYIPLALGDLTFVVVDSGVRHELATGEYMRRQAECRAAVEYFQRFNREVRALRDVPVESVRAQALQMEPVLAARSLHVATEIRRTHAAAAALRRRDFAEFGALLGESHRSLRDDYEVSSVELDRLVEILLATNGVLGARMTGGGFGGCVVALAQRAAVPEIERAVNAGYDVPGARSARVTVVAPGPGASIEFA